jgi:hypothetical protein
VGNTRISPKAWGGFPRDLTTTCSTESWHLILIMAVNKGWHVLQYDVKNAFVHANIDADIHTIIYHTVLLLHSMLVCLTNI